MTRPRHGDQAVAASRRPARLRRTPSRSPRRLPPRAPSRSPDRSAPCRARRLAGRAGSRHGHPLPEIQDNRRNKLLNPRHLPAARRQHDTKSERLPLSRRPHYAERGAARTLPGATSSRSLPELPVGICAEARARFDGSARVGSPTGPGLRRPRKPPDAATAPRPVACVATRAGRAGLAAGQGRDNGRPLRWRDGEQMVDDLGGRGGGVHVVPRRTGEETPTAWIGRGVVMPSSARTATRAGTTPRAANVTPGEGGGPGCCRERRDRAVRGWSAGMLTGFSAGRAARAPSRGAARRMPPTASKLGQLRARHRDTHPARAEIDDQRDVILDGDDPAEAVLIVCYLVLLRERLGRRGGRRGAEGTCGQEAPGGGAGRFHHYQYAPAALAISPAR
jgi:hypothetical protein